MTCSNAHSVTSVQCNTSDEMVRHRSHSATAKLNSLRSEFTPSAPTTPKHNTSRPIKNRAMSVWVGNHGVRYSDEFRNIIYEINPQYLPCVYKEMFENNATNTLRDWEDTNEENYSPTSRKGSANGNGKETNQKPVRCSSAVTYTQTSSAKNDSINGWETCSNAHSVTSVQCSTSNVDEMVRHRSHSATAKLNSLRSEFMPSAPTTPKHNTSRPIKDRVSTTRPSTEKGCIHRDFQVKTQDQQKSPAPHYSTPGYTSRPASPIQYKFTHFEYPENYMEQYRQEYTMRKLDEHIAKKTKTCVCTKTPSTHIPAVPMLPLFCTTDHCAQDSIKLRVTNSFHTDTQTIRAKHEAAKKKQTKPQGNKVSEQQQLSQQQQQQQQQQQCQPQQTNADRKSPHFLLGHNGVLKMEFYNNPLVIDNYQPVQRSVSPVVCRSRPSIPSNNHGHIHPCSASTPFRVYHRK